jgi:hypothetical protein
MRRGPPAPARASRAAHVKDMNTTPDSSTPAATADARHFAVSPWLLAPVAAMVVVVITFSFILSFQAQVELAVDARIPADVAWGWPIIVDGTVVIATISAVILQRRGIRVTWYPWAVLILFGSLSIFVNALHSQATEPELWVLTIISATPAVGLLLSTHLLTTLIGHGSRKRLPVVVQAAPSQSQATSTAPAPAPAATAASGLPARAPSAPQRALLTPAPAKAAEAQPALQTVTESGPARAPLVRSEDVTSGEPDETTPPAPHTTAPSTSRGRAPKPIARTTPALSRDAVVERVVQAQRAGGRTTGADVAAWMKVSPTRGQKILDQILTETEAAA